MPFIVRDENGKIQRISARSLPGSEVAPHTHPDVVAFLRERNQDPAHVESALEELRRTDAEMSRAVEDVFNYTGGRWRYSPQAPGIYRHGSVTADIAAAKAAGLCTSPKVF